MVEKDEVLNVLLEGEEVGDGEGEVVEERTSLAGYVVPYYSDKCEFCARAKNNNKKKAEILRKIGREDEAKKLEKRQMCRIHATLARIRYLRKQKEAERVFVLNPVEPGKVRVQVGYMDVDKKRKATIALTFTENGIFAVTNRRAAKVDSRFLNIFTTAELDEITKHL